jgi:hypothetical protein
MSMSEPLIPKTGPHDEAPGAEPGPGAPGTPPSEEPDVLPEEPPVEGEAAGEIPQDDPPFRTPLPGDRITADELEDRV